MFAFLISDFAIKSRYLHHFFRLRAFWSVCNLKLDLLTLDQGLIAVSVNRTVMHEYILFAGLLNKSVALSIIKPFDLADSF